MYSYSEAKDKIQTTIIRPELKAYPGEYTYVLFKATYRDTLWARYSGIGIK